MKNIFLKQFRKKTLNKRSPSKIQKRLKNLLPNNNSHAEADSALLKLNFNVPPRFLNWTELGVLNPEWGQENDL